MKAPLSSLSLLVRNISLTSMINYLKVLCLQMYVYSHPQDNLGQIEGR